MFGVLGRLMAALRRTFASGEIQEDEKRRLVAWLVSIHELTMLPGGPAGDSRGAEMAARIGAVQRELMIELYMKHFSDTQLRSLEHFYGTEVGQSVADAYRRIAAEYRTNIIAKIRSNAAQLE